MALERKGRYCFSAGRAEDGDDAFRAALDLLLRSHRRARARVLSGRGLLATGWTRLDLAVDVCTEAIVVARAVGAEQEEGRALNALGVATALLGDSRRASTTAAERSRSPSGSMIPTTSASPTSTSPTCCRWTVSATRRSRCASEGTPR